MVSLSNFNIRTNLKVNLDNDKRNIKSKKENKHIERDKPDVKSKKEEIVKFRPHMNDEITYEEKGSLDIRNNNYLYSVVDFQVIYFHLLL